MRMNFILFIYKRSCGSDHPCEDSNIQIKFHNSFSVHLKVKLFKIKVCKHNLLLISSGEFQEWKWLEADDN